jgi:Zn-dependent protease with chaperone function
VPALLGSLMYLPVLVWIASGVGLAYAFRAARPTLVLRLASAFLALWSLLATTLLVWVVAHGGWPALVGIARYPAGALSLFALSAAPLWLEGALGAFGILFVAFLVNQAVGRGTLHMMRPTVLPWPEELRPPAFPVLLLRSASRVPEAFSFTLVTFAGRAHLPRRTEVIVVSRGLVELMTEEELAAVVAHEAGHLRGLDGRYLTFLRTLARLLRWDPVLAFLSARLTSREEFRADDDAVRATGRPLALARALYKASVPNLSGPRSYGAALLGRGGPSGRREALARIRRLVAMAEVRREAEPPGA